MDIACTKKKLSNQNEEFTSLNSKSLPPLSKEALGTAAISSANKLGGCGCG